MSSIKVQILTPDGSKFDGDASGVIVPGVNGSFEVRHNHAPIVSTLEIGSLKLKTADSSTLFAVSGGTIEVSNNVASIIVESAENAEDIDRERAEKAKERALGFLKDSDADKERAKQALLRAENRLKLVLAKA